MNQVVRGLWLGIAFLVQAYRTEAAEDLETPKFVFSLVPAATADGKRRLIGGKPVDPKHWPALATAVVDTIKINGKDVNIHCSATLVGPGVLLTAAHCLDRADGGPLVSDLWLRMGDQDLKLACQVPDAYKNDVNIQRRPRVKEDFALCAFQFGQLPASQWPLFEVVDAFAPVMLKTTVMVTGWGCQFPVRRNGRWDITLVSDSPDTETLTVAEASVTRIVDAVGEDLEHGFMGIESNVYDSVLPATLCKGDSGGSLFTSDEPSDHTAKRRVRAVNSWIRWQTNSSSIVESLMAPLASDGFREFARRWLANGTAICGLPIPGSAPATHCRE